MKKTMAILVVLVISVVMTSTATAAVRVRGYFRSNGTYVQPHYRSNPDGIRSNNWSTYPNVNPYTGKQGTKRLSTINGLNISLGNGPSTLPKPEVLFPSQGSQRRPFVMPSPLPGPTFPRMGGTPLI